MKQMLAASQGVMILALVRLSDDEGGDTAERGNCHRGPSDWQSR